MRVLGIGQGADLGDLYLRLAALGHEVRVHLADPDAGDVFDGMLEKRADWRAELPWVREDPKGLVVFESTGWGSEQDVLRKDGVRVIGGSALGDRLEHDRAYGQNVLSDLGLPTARSHEVEGFEAAIAFVSRDPARYVLKFSGSGFASTRSYVGVLDDAKDLLAVLRLQQRRWRHAETPRLVLMDHLSGVEVGVGAFFDGERFLGPPNLDWEHKRFFPGDLGELTGEMGTVVTYRGADKLFHHTLGRVAPLLRDSRYVGYINLNLIVNDEGAWPLEFTCRFGYPGFAILSALYDEAWDVTLERMVGKVDGPMKTHDGYAVGVVLTVPPFPYVDGYERLSKGMAIYLTGDMTPEDRAALHFSEVRLDGDQLVTAGQIGSIMVVTGRGETVKAARELALARARKVVLPNVRYRTDIGAKLEAEDRATLVRLGWMS